MGDTVFMTQGLCVALRTEEGVGERVPPAAPVLAVGVMLVQVVTVAVAARDSRPVRVPEGVGFMEGDRDALPLEVVVRVRGGEEDGEVERVAPPPTPSAAIGVEVGKDEGVGSPVTVPPPPPPPPFIGKAAVVGVAWWGGGEGDTLGVGEVPP